MRKFLEQLKIRSHNVLYAAFVPLAASDYARSPKLSALFDNQQNLVQYLNTLFKFAITVGAIIAVLRLLYAGYMYMMSDVWTSKETAKGIFRDVFLGLLLLLSIYIILYQINPNLLNLDVKLAPITPAEMAGPTVTTPVPGAAGCANCVPIPSGVPAKPPGLGCKIVAPGPCKVSPTMASKLSNLSSAISLPWQVNEAWPPTVPHAGGDASCHNNGTCIDAGFTNSSAATAYNIAVFQGAASNAGLTAYWEVGDQARMNQLRAIGIGPMLVVPPPPGTVKAEHFHITGG